MSLFLYDLRVIEERHVTYFTNALAIVVEVIVGEITSWRHDDGDHGFMPVTKVIMTCLKDGDQRRKMILAISSHFMICM